MSSDKKKEEKKSKKEIVEEAAEELSESSSEEEELALLGFFELKKGPKADFKPVYGIVSSGSLFWYKDSRVRDFPPDFHHLSLVLGILCHLQGHS